MTSGSRKYTPYLRTLVLQYEEPASGVYVVADGFGQEFTSTYEPPPGTLWQEFNVQVANSGINSFGQEFEVIQVEDYLGQEFDVTGIVVHSGLNQEFNVSGIQTSDILGQEFTTSAINTEDPLGQEYDITGILTSSGLNQEFDITSINTTVSLGQEFTGEILASGFLGQEFTIEQEVTSGLNQEFEIALTGSGVLGQEFTMSGLLDGLGELGQEFNISGINADDTLGQEFAAAFPSGSFLGQEFSTVFADDSTLGQEFQGFIGTTLGQQFIIPAPSYVETGTTYTGEKGFVHKAPEITLSGLSLEGDQTGEDPLYLHSSINIIVDEAEATVGLDELEFRYGVNDPTMPETYTYYQWWTAPREHRFLLSGLLQGNDLIYYAVTARHGYDHDLVQFVPDIFATESISGVFQVTAPLTDERRYPALTTIQLRDINRLPKVILWERNDSGKLIGTHVSIDTSEVDLGNSRAIEMGEESSLDSREIDTDIFFSTAVTTVGFDARSREHRVAVFTQSGVA